MKRFLSMAGAALGVTTVCNLGIADTLLSPDHYTVFHWSGRPALLFVPTFLDFLIPWLIVTLLFVVTQRPKRLQVIVWTGVAVFLPLIAIRDWALIKEWNIPHKFMLGAVVVALSVFLFVVFRWRPEFQPTFDRVQRFMITLLCFAAVSGMIVLGELGWAAWKARSLNYDVSFHHSSSQRTERRAGGPRTIWIVLDELSYEQTYEQRFPGLQLPEFDRLAAQSTMFTHVVPAGIRTHIVLPSLISGVPGDAVKFSGDGRQVLMHNPESGKWWLFDEHATVFQDARDLGDKTALAGWYNPYCRMMPKVLDSCYWRFADPAQMSNMLPYGTISENMAEPYLTSYPFLARLASRLFKRSSTGTLDAERHISDYSSVFAQADRMLEDTSNTFVLVHMPIPHPDGIYSRAKGVMTTGPASYIDNLALTDQYLGHVRSVLERNGQWDSSAIVLMGDHSWRTKLMWTSLPDWTQEDQVASHGGQFDDRPAYLVKLPGQHQGYRIDKPFVALNTRKLLDAIMSGQINSPESLAAWVAAR